MEEVGSPPSGREAGAGAQVPRDAEATQARTDGRESRHAHMAPIHLSSTKLHGISSVILPSDAKYLHVCNKTESQFLYEPLFTA